MALPRNPWKFLVTSEVTSLTKVEKLHTQSSLSTTSIPTPSPSDLHLAARMDSLDVPTTAESIKWKFFKVFQGLGNLPSNP